MLIIVACADYIARRRDGAKCGRVAIDPIPTIEFVAFSSDASYVNHFWFSADHAISETVLITKKIYLI